VRAEKIFTHAEHALKMLQTQYNLKSLKLKHVPLFTEEYCTCVSYSQNIRHRVVLQLVKHLKYTKFY